jgi:hypothetical protein
MKIVVISLRKEDHAAEEFAPLLDAEAKTALGFVADDFFRELYSIEGGRGAVAIVEAESEAAAREKMADLPLAKAGLLDMQFYPVTAFRAIGPLAEML